MKAWLLVLLAIVCVACGASPQAQSNHPVQARARTPMSSLSPNDPYLALGSTLHRHRVQVWYEADLVRAWQSGPAALRTAAVRLGQLAKGTHVAGFKIADELGYNDGIHNADEGVAFLRAAARALKSTAPGTPLLIDAVVPDLGCLPWRGPTQAACAAHARSSYPAADMAAVTGYLRTGLVDRLDLSTGLLEPKTYAGWGITLQQAQQEAWQHAHDLGWGSLTALQSRKALAAAGGYQGSSRQAADDLAVYVDAPSQAGAAAVDVWTWRQPYDGQTVSLLPASLKPNALWAGLTERHARGVALMTHMTPSAMPTSSAAIDRECAEVARAFKGVFVAAGTG